MGSGTTWWRGALVSLAAFAAGCQQGQEATGAAVAHAERAEVIAAGDSPRTPDPLDQLDAALASLSESGATPHPVPPPEPTPRADDELPTVEALSGEVAELRQQVARLQETLDLTLSYLVGELHEENRELRAQMRERDAAAARSTPAAVQDSQPIPAAVESTPPSLPVSRVDYGDAGYLAVKVWGRTPEQALEVSASTSSLRGMICAVPPGLSQEELIAVGKKIRSDCDGYDNVNVEVFDDESAARRYAEENVRSAQHYVMNIMRHKASGRDVILLARKGGAHEVVVIE